MALSSMSMTLIHFKSSLYSSLRHIAPEGLTEAASFRENTIMTVKDIKIDGEKEQHKGKIVA